MGEGGGYDVKKKEKGRKGGRVKEGGRERETEMKKIESNNESNNVGTKTLWFDIILFREHKSQPKLSLYTTTE